MCGKINLDFFYDCIGSERPILYLLELHKITWASLREKPGFGACGLRLNPV